MKKIKYGKLIRGMSSADYHAHSGSISSSKLKDLLDDEETYFKKYVEKSVEKEDNPVFDIGTYFHTAVLEPHLLKDEHVVFNGSRRFGRVWDSFKKKAKGKAILTRKEIQTAEKLVKAVKDSPVAMDYVERGEKEVSLFIRLIVYRGEIYAPDFKRVMTHNGWTVAHAPKKGVEVIAKVRADNMEPGDFVQDLKSTSSNVRSAHDMRSTVSQYCYDLSAALYLDLFELVTGKPWKTGFVWTFASKSRGNCRSYVASSSNIMIGRSKWTTAIKKFAAMEAAGWEFDDSLETLEPQFFEREWLKEDDGL